jgi:hypothetical protein
VNLNLAFEIEQLVIIAFARIELNDDLIVFGFSGWMKVGIFFDHFCGNGHLNEHGL